MKLLVCGPIAYGNIRKIREIQKFLRNRGFEVIDQFQNEEMNYSDVRDFRDKKELAVKIVENDLSYIKECDVVIAVCEEPSFGTAIELYQAKKLGKKVIVFSEKPQPSPWPIAFSDEIARNKEELVEALLKL